MAVVRPGTTTRLGNAGLVAAWAADEALLGDAPAAKATLAALAARGVLGGPGGSDWPTGRAYVDKLWRVLTREHYLT